MVGFDEYDRKARLAPGLFTTIPVAFLVVALGLKSYPVVASIGAVIVGTGGTYLLAVLVRHMGRKAEIQLHAQWDGRPTTILLRLRTPAKNPIQRDGWRSSVEILTGLQLLTAEEEAVDPTRADQTIEAAVPRVLHLGQEARYRLVKQENIQYGFERNLYGVRHAGRLIAVACVAVLVACLVFGPVTVAGKQVPTAALAICLVLDALALAGWIVIPSARRTRLAGNRYATQLLQAVDVEARTGAPKPP